MATDLPEPVVPATSRCGMRARSTVIGVPPMSLPMLNINCPEARSKASEASSSRRCTISRLALGSSMPMTLRPRTTAARTDMALMERAMSSESPITRAVLTPGAGSNS